MMQASVGPTRAPVAGYSAKPAGNRSMSSGCLQALIVICVDIYKHQWEYDLTYINIHDNMVGYLDTSMVIYHSMFINIHVIVVLSRLERFVLWTP